jgi:hypothetical protein
VSKMELDDSMASVRGEIEQLRLFALARMKRTQRKPMLRSLSGLPANPMPSIAITSRASCHCGWGEGGCDRKT